MMSQNWDARDFDERRSSNSASGTSSNTNNNNDQKFIPLEAETEKQFREQSLNRLKQFIDETASDPEKAMKDPKTVGQKVLNLIIETCEIWNPPKFLWRTAATLLLAGNVCYRLLLKPSVKLKKRINMKQTVEQIARIGPETLGVAMMTSSFVGLVFTIQFCKEFSKVGLKNVIGGLLGLAFARELTPVICAIVLAGRVGSAIAAELGTMQVTSRPTHRFRHRPGGLFGHPSRLSVHDLPPYFIVNLLRAIDGGVHYPRRFPLRRLPKRRHRLRGKVFRVERYRRHVRQERGVRRGHRGHFLRVGDDDHWRR